MPVQNELAGTPTSREKLVFKKPFLYVGEKANAAPEPVHLEGKSLWQHYGTNLQTSKSKCGHDSL